MLRGHDWRLPELRPAVRLVRVGEPTEGERCRARPSEERPSYVSDTERPRRQLGGLTPGVRECIPTRVGLRPRSYSSTSSRTETGRMRPRRTLAFRKAGRRATQGKRTNRVPPGAASLGVRAIGTSDRSEGPREPTRRVSEGSRLTRRTTVALVQRSSASVAGCEARRTMLCGRA